jgi:hypothetical protein
MTRAEWSPLWHAPLASTVAGLCAAIAALLLFGCCSPQPPTPRPCPGERTCGAGYAVPGVDALWRRHDPALAIEVDAGRWPAYTPGMP